MTDPADGPRPPRPETLEAFLMTRDGPRRHVFTHAERLPRATGGGWRFMFRDVSGGPSEPRVWGNQKPEPGFVPSRVTEATCVECKRVFTGSWHPSRVPLGCSPTCAQRQRRAGEKKENER